MSKPPSISDLWDFSDIASSEARFQEWINKVPDIDPYQLELKTQLARTYSLRSRFDEAHTLLDEIEPHIKRDAAVEVRYLLERGRTYNSAKEPEKAIPLFEQAWQVGNVSQLDFLTVDAAHMLAIAIPDSKQQVSWHTKAIELAQKSDQTDAKKWLGSLYNNLGWTYHDMGEYEQALATFQKALEWCEQQGDQKKIHIAKYTVARTLRSLERYDEALKILKSLTAEDGFVSEEIGECLLLLDRENEAKPHFKKAYELLKDISWISKDRLERLNRLSN